MKIGIVVSTFHEWLAEQLLKGCLDELEQAGLNKESITVLKVPGAFEIPWGVRHLIDTAKPDGIVTLGVIIRGETRHHEFIANSVFNALQNLTVEHRIPITCGILTTENTLQAMERAGGKHGHKGREATRALLACLKLRSLNPS